MGYGTAIGLGRRQTTSAQVRPVEYQRPERDSVLARAGPVDHLACARPAAEALSAFTRDLGGRMADVVVLTMSEFGRTVAENGNRGTDHGHATAMLVLGGGVRGGNVYGRWPGLAREQLFEGRDVAVTTDFRTLFSEIATRHLGVPATAPIFPGWSPSAPTLDVLA